jgi:hypothetical protein
MNGPVAVEQVAEQTGRAEMTKSGGRVMEVETAPASRRVSRKWNQVTEMQRFLLSKRTDLHNLRGKLLELGGEEVLVAGDECACEDCAEPPSDSRRLLERGQCWSGKGARFTPMRFQECHVNSYLLMLAGLGQIATGYAVTNNGLWVRHSWVITPVGGIIETTVRRTTYFGAVLSKEEIPARYRDFVVDCSLPLMFPSDSDSHIGNQVRSR